jgi:predicted lipoprotein with Yx(FWY)xxD motif
MYGGLLALGLLAVALALLAGCGTGSGNGGANSGVSCVSSDVPICIKSVQVSGTTETVLARQDGRTLYTYKPDTSTNVVCTSLCSAGWPALTISSDPPSSIGGLSGLVSTLSGGNGKQVCYNGHPLYAYAGDFGTGDANGEGQENGNWHVATPDTPLQGAPSTSPSSPTATPGSNYGY